MTRGDLSCSDRWEKRTFRACKDTGIRAFLERLVELSSESRIGDTAKVVVGLNVFLDGLTAVVDVHVSEKSQASAAAHTRKRRVRQRRQ